MPMMIPLEKGLMTSTGLDVKVQVMIFWVLMVIQTAVKVQVMTFWEERVLDMIRMILTDGKDQVLILMDGKVLEPCLIAEKVLLTILLEGKVQMMTFWDQRKVLDMIQMILTEEKDQDLTLMI